MPRRSQIKLSTGRVTFPMTTLPQTRISGCDGRHVVVAESRWYDDPTATVHDTRGEPNPVVVGNAALLR